MWFEIIFSLKINLDEIEIIPIGRVAKVEELASMLDCRIRRLHTSYLGLHLEAFLKSSKV